jgi:hypothetical protein
MPVAHHINRDACISCGSGNLREISNGSLNVGHGTILSLTTDPWGDPNLSSGRPALALCKADFVCPGPQLHPAAGIEYPSVVYLT